VVQVKAIYMYVRFHICNLTARESRRYAVRVNIPPVSSGTGSEAREPKGFTGLRYFAPIRCEQSRNSSAREVSEFPIRIERLLRSTNEVLIWFGSNSGHPAVALLDVPSIPAMHL
jgi:hypothetical protein